MNLTELINLIKISKSNIKDLLIQYNSDDWIEIFNFIIEENYKINKYYNHYYKHLIYRDVEFEMFLIVWFPNAESPIHNHPDEGCWVKILSGELDEYIYSNLNNELSFIDNKKLLPNDINFKVGTNIVHKIKSLNISSSLHIYLPPNFKANFFI